MANSNLNSDDYVPLTIRLPPNTLKDAEQVARAKGISISEHVRTLVIEDNDRRGLVNARLLPSGSSSM